MVACFFYTSFKCGTHSHKACNDVVHLNYFPSYSPHLLMPVHKLIHQQQLPADIDTVWKFFSGANNLQAITPEYMNFRVTSGELAEDIYPGMIITYKVSPILKFPLFWMTEITHIVPGRLFVDEQRRGPYRLWHHQHHFEEKEGGVLMTDIVHYQLPLGFLGEIAHQLFVKKQLTDIFSYRKERVAGLFNKQA
jgi:ligand-binding SRPBCC domain-containing protein